MKKLAAIGALGLMASGLFAQGLNSAGQVKDDWEEINFEFNSSILSDGYPSLLRLADLLNQHKDYRVKIAGHTDYVGSAAYNDKLALARADSVKNFLVKYGAAADQLSTASEGKGSPEVDNKTKEGRFMNRRVVLTVTDATGKVIKEGGISDVLPAMTALQDLAKKQQDCCDQILKRLDKLDDILAALKNLQGENDRLKTEVADLRNQQNAMQGQMNGAPKPITEPQAQAIAQTAEENGAKSAANQVAANEKERNKIISNVAINLGPAFGAGRLNDRRVTASANGQLFAPFGADRNYAVQAQGEYMYLPGTQEGQFDLGLVNRVGPFQAGGFASFKYLNLGQYQQGGILGQASFLADYLFSRGRIGVFGTKGFKRYAVLNSITLAPGAYLQTYARTVDQVGVDGAVGVWDKAYVQGNVGMLMSHNQDNKPGFSLKLVQPLHDHIAFTTELGYNETLLNSKNSARLAFGLLFGGLMNPRDFGQIKTPVPMDVPRVRYELGTRRVGSSPPIADAGPDQLNVTAGTITLDGSGSYDPLGLTLTYSWTQVAGPPVTLSSPGTAKTTFTSLAGQSYSFRLTVKNTDGLQATDTVTVSTQAVNQVRVLQFSAAPANIAPGDTSTLNWVVENATSVTITPTPGAVDSHSGSSSVKPAQTTIYTLTATGPGGTVNSTVTVTVTTPQPPEIRILQFSASPQTIAPGDSSTIAWVVEGATSVTINPTLGSVDAHSGTSSVKPSATTTYTLTATGPAGSLNSTVTISVVTPKPGEVRILQFAASPATINPGGSSSLNWVVENATSVTISPSLGSVDAHSGSSAVTPSASTTYTLTATGPGGTLTSTVVVTVSPIPPGNPQIVRFVASPVSIAPGQSSTLSWTTTGTDKVTISGLGEQPANGSATVTPSQTTTYTLTATTNDGHSVTAPVTVSVVPPSIPQVVMFVANPQNINAGESSRLCWQVTGATSITISPGIGGGLNGNDCANVTPSTTTTYTLTATNAAGQIQANATVNVGILKIISFTADPPFSPVYAGPVTLSWQTQGATSVVIVGADITSSPTLPVNGSLTINPKQNGTYTLTAYGPGGQTVSTSISVFVR